jgi:hypothetical protein
VIVHDAAATFVDLIHAALWWAGAIAAAVVFVAAVVAFAAGPLIAPRVRAVRKGLGARLRAEVPENAPRVLRLPDRRPTPRWALPPDGTPEVRKPHKAA